MKLKKLLKIVVFNMLLTIIVVVTSTSYAFWASGIVGSSKIENILINIGTWLFEPIVNDPEDPYSDPIDREDPLVEIPEGVEEYDPNEEYEDGDIVYYDGMLYVFVEGVTSNDGTPDEAWANYHTYSSYVLTYREYDIGDVIIYEVNGIKYLFRASSHSYLDNFDLVVSSNAWHPYYKYVYDYIPNKNYEGFSGFPGFYSDGIVKYNGDFYSYNWANQIPSPNPYGGWSILNIAYNNSTNYSVGDLATQDGNIYIVVNAQRANIYEPNEHQSDAWNLIYGDQYRSFNTYEAGDVVSYNNVYFEAVEGGTYNSNFPGEVINSWNRVDTYYFKTTNTYKIGDKVLYNGVMYVAVEDITSVTKYPGSSSAWEQVN